MSTTTNVAAATLQNLQQLDQEALTGLLNKLSVLDDPTVDRVVVELRVKQVRDEEAPEDSQVGEATL
jgi:hypothetical protein|tara:strand:+ start:714 stop:914 length:201 start_codon:yes stop_codon:yes gene_type:complete